MKRLPHERSKTLRQVMLGAYLASLTLTGCHPQDPRDPTPLQRIRESTGTPAEDLIQINDTAGLALLHRTSTPTLGQVAVLEQLANSMRTIVSRHRADGLAAVQVGVPARFIILRRDTGRHTSRLDVMADPVILSRSARAVGSWERCLSVPWGYRYTERAASLRIRYRSLDGRRHEEDVDGGEAVVLQHELDHLDGKLLSDGLSQRDFIPAARIAGLAAAVENDCRRAGQTDCTALMRTRWLQRFR